MVGNHSEGGEIRELHTVNLGNLLSLYELGNWSEKVSPALVDGFLTTNSTGEEPGAQSPKRQSMLPVPWSHLPH